MQGWFDLSRENGGPTLYAYSNRTSVIGDVHTITLCIVFGTLYLAFFVVFPGIRKERFTTFISVTLSLFVGTAILLGKNGSGWHVGNSEIASSYRAFSNEKIMGKIGVYIGLSHVNVTLEAMPIYYNTTKDINFNERFSFDRPTQLQDEFRKALVKGLPFPILTVAEYLSVDAEGFCWGRGYRNAGYMTSIFLWAAFVSWLAMNLLLIVVPRYGAYLMTLTGSLMIFSNFVYWSMIPGRPLVIRVEEAIITFDFGWCFWLILIAGCVCLMIGGSISVIDLIYPHKFSTIIEMDYGTPFDRHTIIEDSHETKKKKKNALLPKTMEEPTTMGFGGLLRRLSKRDRDPGSRYGQHPGGQDNYAFEMEAPKSPWRYPHLMFRTDSRKNKNVSFKNRSGNHLELPGFHDQNGSSGNAGGFLHRTDSKDSECSSSLNSIINPAGLSKDELRSAVSVPPSYQDRFRPFKRTDSSESSASSLASFGGLSAILSRKDSRNNKAPPGGIHATKRALQQAHAQHQLHNNSNGHSPIERIDSGQSVVSRGFVLQQGGDSSPEASEKAKGADEVAILVGGRKNSTTEAKRRLSAEHQRSEASMW